MQKFKKNFTTKFAKDDPTDDSREYLFVPSEDDEINMDIVKVFPGAR